jgi:diaminohydroxyphosphoribosylaminopyrimidine deaminase/5-amino-6-(5-phosphoribosylamino)uracil reductase
MNLDIFFLKKALALAQKRQGFCAPNPSVGAVIVKDNKIIATGNHFAAGYPHAEVEALKKLKAPLQGATLYCTLEPCCHWGKTPPCTEAIIQAGIQKVIYGFKDPHPAVNGQSEALLKQAGIPCIQTTLPAIDAFYQAYERREKIGLPFVTAKLAVSLDGKIAFAGGAPATISGEKAAQFTHQNRLKSEAILTTAKTILADDPQLNVRIKSQIIKKPIYIIDRKRRLPREAKIFQTAEKVTVFDQPGISLLEVLKTIAKEGISDLWVEAGGTLFTALAHENLLQKAYVYVSPQTLGEGSIPAFPSKTDVFKHAKLVRWSSKGEDIIGEFCWS